MTRSAIKARVRVLRASAGDVQIARWAALAIALAVIEGGLPSPLPGVKPGLANIIVLLVFYRAGWQAATWVSLLRVLGASLVLGGFFSPGFAMSLTGCVFSLAALALAQYLPLRWFGPVSVSLLMALAHMAGQLALARLWLIPHNGMLYLLPLFAGAAVLFGVINGLLVAWLQRQLAQEKT